MTRRLNDHRLLNELTDQVYKWLALLFQTIKFVIESGQWRMSMRLPVTDLTDNELLRCVGISEIGLELLYDTGFF